VHEDTFTANNAYYHTYDPTPATLSTTTMTRTKNLDSLLSVKHNHITTGTITTTTMDAKLIEDDTNSVMDRTLKIEEMRKRVEAQLDALTRGNDFQQLRLQVAQLRTTNTTKLNTIPTTTTMMTMTATRTTDNAAWTNSSFSDYDLDFGVEHQATSPKQHSSDRSLIIPDTPIITTTDDLAPIPIHAINNNVDAQQPVIVDLTMTKTEHKTSKASSTKSMVTTTDGTATITTTTAQVVVDTVYVQSVDLVDPYGDAGTYTGELSVSKRKPHGVGEMTYQDGRVFSGGWFQGQWHGKGKNDGWRTVFIVVVRSVQRCVKTPLAQPHVSYMFLKQSIVFHSLRRSLSRFVC
jgi:hypothetical protein